MTWYRCFKNEEHVFQEPGLKSPPKVIKAKE